MASKHFEGQLLEPVGDAASNDKLRFTHTSTTGQTIGGAQSVVTIDAAGFYSFDLEYGIIQVEYFSETANRWRVVGSVTINSDITATTITALLNAVTPATPELVLELQQILSDADQIVVDAQNSADAAAQSATDAANSAVENGKVIKSILVAEGLSGNYGFFADGFAYNFAGDVGIDVDGKIYTYAGSDPLPVNVEPATNPVGDSDYQVVNFKLEPFKTVTAMRAHNYSAIPADSRIEWQGYYTQSDGGSNWGVLKKGDSTSLVDDGGSIFIIINDAVNGVWVEANLKGKRIGAAKFGTSGSNDTSAIQAAYNYCIANNRTTIRLSGTVDLTGGTVMLSSTNFIPTVHFENGELKKTDGGFMFSRLVADRGQDAPRFYNVKFLGDTTGINQTVIIDCDRMIRPVWSNCFFESIAAVFATTYTQSIRMDGCEMFRATSNFLHAEQHIDLVLINNKFETSPNFPLVYAFNDSGSSTAITVGRISYNVIEGYTNVAPIQISSASALEISNNYFEACNGEIEFLDSSGLKNINGVIENNGFFGTFADTNINFMPGANVAGLSVINNISNIPNSPTKGFTNKDVPILEKNRMTALGNLIAGGTPHIQRTLDVFQTTVSEISPGVGLRVKIDNFMRKDTNISEIMGTAFLVNISGTMRSTTNYRASYTGILSFVGTVRVGVVQTQVMLTHLNKAGTDGDDSNAQGSDANINIKFFNADVEYVPITTQNESIVIDFSQLKYTGTPLIEKVSIIPMSNILTESSFYTPKY